MPNSSPLDMPLEKGRVTVRQAHSTFMEFIIGSTNAAFLLLFTVTSIWGTLEDGFTLFLFIPYVFAFVIGVAICTFLWDWRKHTLAYQKTGATASFKDNKLVVPTLFAGMALFFWGLYSLYFGYKIASGELDSWRLIGRYCLFLLPGLILGPIQYFYLHHLDRLRNLVLAYDKQDS